MRTTLPLLLLYAAIAITTFTSVLAVPVDRAHDSQRDSLPLQPRLLPGSPALDPYYTKKISIKTVKAPGSERVKFLTFIPENCVLELFKHMGQMGQFTVSVCTFNGDQRGNLFEEFFDEMTLSCVE
ncbi:hypothetical protein BDP27DRAFT_1418499 [Rhodocollybia butyracea]|uniref:Uncharacterized protein n=1 Tax=Rhodocollybia butyracea TaxID=206335 RepID=A0A9P5PTU6_9AGAR|nr:hypothetical protein BDP27DRAFT_1421083 [Rhodocollybia butyracea]KAF9071922.1 hypothetical protein BDP27DRAFT_1418499 [Rhodocollybia butyracea]